MSPTVHNYVVAHMTSSPTAPRETTTTMPTTNVPQALQHNGILFTICGFLPYSEARLFLGSSKSLWQQREAFETHVTTLTLSSRNQVEVGLLVDARRWLNYRQSLSWVALTRNLVRLNVGPHGSNQLLSLLRESECTGTLRSLVLAESEHVTDTGLWYLGVGEEDYQTEPLRPQLSIAPGVERVLHGRLLSIRPYHHESPFRALEDIDITFCLKTTYIGTFFLRDGLPKLNLIRRQPEWLTGRFFTPFANNENDGEDGNIIDDSNNEAKTEIHTYWPDGTFSFTRDEQSCGFVRDVWPWDLSSKSDHDFVGDKLQYTNCNLFGDEFSASLGYRPGVSLLRLRPELDLHSHDEEMVPCVLVAQNIGGLKPPPERHLMEQCKDSVPLGETKYYYCSGAKHCLTETRAPDHEGPFSRGSSNRPSDFPTHIISKMKVTPLDSDTIMPPRDLVEKTRAVCKLEIEQNWSNWRDRIDYLEEQYLDFTEMFLHDLLMNL